MIDRVLVSTDSSDYRTICLEAGAEVPFLRPDELSDDEASSEDCLVHALQWLEKKENYIPDVLVFLQCTSPLTQTDDIDACIRLVREGADCSFTVTASHSFLWNRDESGSALGVNHDQAVRLRRQDRKPEFRETGACYAMRAESFLEHRHRFFGKVAIHEVPSERSWEIDDETDWQICEFLADRSNRKKKEDAVPSEKPRAIVFDFDGVFTDNKVTISEDGVESVVCNRSDGLGVGLFREACPDIELLILSKEQNPVVLTRAQKLGIPVLHGVDDKVAVLDKWLTERGLKWDEIAYLGNDLNDLGCLEKAGLGCAVADSYPEVKDIANLVLSCEGGKGAVREFLDRIRK